MCTAIDDKFSLTNKQQILLDTVQENSSNQEFVLGPMDDICMNYFRHFFNEPCTVSYKEKKRYFLANNNTTRTTDKKTLTRWPYIHYSVKCNFVIIFYSILWIFLFYVWKVQKMFQSQI